MRGLSRISSVVAAALVSTVVVVSAEPAAAAAASPAPAPAPPPLAKPTPLPPSTEDRPSPTDRNDPAWVDPTVTLPPVATTEVAVGARGLTRAGALPVSVGRGASGTAPGRVRVRMLSQREVSAAGGRLIGFELTRADGGATATSVSLSVDYSGIARAYGGNFGSRLRLVRATTCAPDRPCMAPRVPATNDVAASRIDAANVTVQPDPTAGTTDLASDTGFGRRTDGSRKPPSKKPAPTMYTLSAMASGPTGDYGATQVLGSDQWSVGIGSGAFTYSYPFGLPPAVAGSSPTLSLDYSSQAVDGRTVAANGQPSQVGEGWSFEPGFIDRKFHSCVTENGKADLCWSANNTYSIRFGGKSAELVRKSGTNEWRLRGNDPGWRIRSFTGGNNGDNDDEYFMLFTPDGTKVWFGYGIEPRNTPTNYTHSVLEVPVYASGSSEPCWTGVATTSWCQQAHRWNIDRIEDPNGNVSTYFYQKEYNRYARGGLAAQSTTYARAGYPYRVEYSQNDGYESETAPAKVTFATQDRCEDQVNCPAATPTNSTAYPDVPLDQMCTATCSATEQKTPTFWSTKQINTATTWVLARNGTAPSYTYSYTDVTTYSMTYKFPGTGDTTSPSLWLDEIKQTGAYGTPISLVPVRFDGERLPNRADAGVPVLNKWRVDTVSNELGARATITYGLPHDCGSTTPTFSNNQTDCYPTLYDPQDGVTQPGWALFHKYLVTQMVLDDGRYTNTPARTTNYYYNDTPAWHHDDSLLAPATSQSWSDYRGHSSVRVVTDGDGSSAARTDVRYKVFRGMNGDKSGAGTPKVVNVGDSWPASFPDDPHLSGQILETRYYSSDGNDLKTIFHRFGATLSVDGPDGYQSHDAMYVRETGTTERVWDQTPTSAYRFRDWRMTYDTVTGMVLSVSNDGDRATQDDDSCAKTQYTENTTTGTTPSDVRWIIDKPFRTQVYSDACGTGATAVMIAKTEYYYDGNVFQGVPSAGNMTTKLEYTDSVKRANTTIAYDTKGRVVAVTPPGENVRPAAERKTVKTTFTPSTGYPYDGITNENVLGHKTTTYLHFHWGTPSKVVDTNGFATTVIADALGRTVKVVRPGDAAGAPSLLFDYAIGLGAPTMITTKQLQHGGTYASTYSYLDGFGREVEVQEAPINAGETGRRVSATRYNVMGQKAATTAAMSAPGLPDSGVANPALTSIPNETRYVYDELGRTLSATQFADGGAKYVTKTVYHGLYHTVDAEERSDVDYHTDVFGRVSKIVERPTAATTATTKLTYTTFGDVATVTDASNHVTTHTYDWLRRRLSTDDPDTGLSSNTYSYGGQILTSADANERELRYEYDRIGRATNVYTRPMGDTGTGVRVASWEYDGATNGDGKPWKSTRYATDATGAAREYTTGFTGYDSRGRVSGKFWTVPFPSTTPTTYTYNYTYDSADHLKTVTAPAAGGLPQEVVTTGYNDAGHAVTMTSDLTDGAYVTGTTYRADGKIASRTIGITSPTLVRTYDYEPNAARLSTIKTTKTGDTVPLEQLTYGYDRAGNVTSVSDLTAGSGSTAQRECFTYDDLSRLVEAFTTKAVSTPSTDCSATRDATFGTAAPYHLTYGYDKIGNMLSATSVSSTGTQSVTTYEYDQAYAHRVASIRPSTVAKAPSNTYGYDDNGATTSRPSGNSVKTLVWDDTHKLTAVKDGATTEASFVYDANGARLLRVAGGKTTLYLDGMELAATGPTAAEVEGTRYYGNVALRTRTAKRALLRNHQNSASTSISADLTSVERQRYLPFGARRNTATMSTDHGFLDQPEDPTGLVATGARYYDPAIGRFMSVDPLVNSGNPQSLNGYGYSLNNPTTLTDPSGLSPTDPDAYDTVDPCPAKNACDPDTEETHPYKFKVFLDTVVKGDVTDDRIVAGVVWTEEEKAMLSAAFLYSPCVNEVETFCGGNSPLLFSCQLAGGSDCYRQMQAAQDTGSMLVGFMFSSGGAINSRKTSYTNPKPRSAGRGDGARKYIEGVGSMDPCSCFVAGTTVATERGDRPIETIAVGDKVWARDLETGQRRLRTVVSLFSRPAHELMDVTVGGTTVTVTPKHPFYVPGHGWVMSGDLEAGDRLLQRDGDVVTVTAVRRFAAATKVYNFTVDGDHDYYVGPAQLLVHNCDEPSEEAKLITYRAIDHGHGEGAIGGMTDEELEYYVQWMLDHVPPEDKVGGGSIRWEGRHGAVLVIDDNGLGNVFPSTFDYFDRHRIQ